MTTSAKPPSLSRQFAAASQTDLGRRCNKGRNLTALLQSEGAEPFEQASEDRRKLRLNKIGIVSPFFALVKGTKLIKCLLCPHEKRFSIAKSQGGNNSTLTRHIQQQHQEAWKSVYEILLKNQAHPKPEHYDEVKSASLEFIFHVVQKRRRQSIDTYVHKRRRTGDAMERGYMSVLTFVLAGIPFSNLARPDFRTMLSVFAGCNCDGLQSCLKCNVISRGSVHSRLLDIRNCVVEILAKRLACEPSISITIDGWSDIQRRKYVGVTAHWIASSWKMFSAVLGVETVIGDSSAVNIQKHFQEIVNRYDRESSTFLIASGTSDNEPAMVRCVVDILDGEEMDRLPCLPHSLCLVIKDVFEANSIVKKCRDCVSKFRTPKLEALLRAHCTEESHNKLVRPAETRWSFEFYTVSRVLELVKPVNEILSQELVEGIIAFSDVEIESMRAVVDLLGIFEKVIRHSEGEGYVTVAQVPKWIKQIQDSLLPNPTLDSTEKLLLKEKLSSSFTRRISPLLEVSECPKTREEREGHLGYYVHPSGVKLHYCVLAAALHPAHRKLKFLSKEERKLVRQRLRYEAMEIDPSLDLEHSDARSSEEGSSSDSDDLRPNIDEEYRQNELLGLLRMDHLMKKWQDKNDCLGFWRSHESQVPELARVARQVLAVPASSAPCERLFSCIGFLDRRAHGSSDHAGDATMIRANSDNLGETPREKLETILTYVEEQEEKRKGDVAEVVVLTQ